jgi:hypothetical protein
MEVTQQCSVVTFRGTSSLRLNPATCKAPAMKEITLTSALVPRPANECAEWE